MAETVYLETSIFGYLTARPSQNLILVANVEVTREWWQLQKIISNSMSLKLF
ncbi:hypothetical protein [Synechocystis salina]|uniref:hypothetical protein n=1 Tax=Synechocystis salina TaxID=945780 RepID=UPI002AD4E6F9|nr:hypothetical protein [Synechocystis salina]